MNTLRKLISRYRFRLEYPINRWLHKVALAGLDEANSFAVGRPLLNTQVENPWVYHDETWLRVVHRWPHRQLIRGGLAVEVDDSPQSDLYAFECYHADAFHVFNRADTADEWVYLNLDPEVCNWRNYRWAFRMRKRTDFWELQFGLRYRDFYNRYRLRFQDNMLFYDKVYKGMFFNDLASADCPLVLGRWYDVAIDVFGKELSVVVDGELKLRVTDPLGTFKTGSVALILWENDGCTDIGFDIENMAVNELHNDAPR